MTQDEIIEMAREAGCVPLEAGGFLVGTLSLEHFAKLVAEKAAAKEREAFAVHAVDIARRAIAEEREACAKVCEDGVQSATDWDSSYWDQACQNRAAAIRARGQE